MELYCKPSTRAAMQAALSQTGADAPTARLSAIPPWQFSTAPEPGGGFSSDSPRCSAYLGRGLMENIGPQKKERG